MEFHKKEIVLRDGRKYILRSPNECDAKGMIEYLKTISEETYFTVRYPEEIEITLEEEKKNIKAVKNSYRDIIISVFNNNEMIGSTSLRCVGNNIKLRHRAVLGIAIKRRYWNNGIGSILIKEIIKEGIKIGYEQIELGVFSDNKKAIRLYRKNGFEIWGRNKNAFKLRNGRYCDEVIMGLML